MFRITNTTSGHELGTYAGNDEWEAYLSMCRDAGACPYAEIPAQLEITHVAPTGEEILLACEAIDQLLAGRVGPTTEQKERWRAFVCKGVHYCDKWAEDNAAKLGKFDHETLHAAIARLASFC